jgi:hypothetical protein
MAEKEKREWNIKEQAEIARESFEKRPAWVKSISHFSGTNTSSGSGSSSTEIKKTSKK